MKKLAIYAAWIFASAPFASAATLYHSDLAIPFPLTTGDEATFHGGEAFFRLDGDRLDYQIWASVGYTSDFTATLTSGDSNIASLPLSFIGVENVLCYLTIVNPYLPVYVPQIGDVITIPEGFVEQPVCQAFSTYDVYEGSIEMAGLAELLGDPVDLTVRIPTSFPSASDSNRGNLVLVPEPGAGALLAVSLFGLALRRNRHNKSAHANPLPMWSRNLNER